MRQKPHQCLGWEGAIGHYFSVRGRSLCRLVHMFIVDLQLAATQNRQVSGKLEGNRSDINYRFGMIWVWFRLD